MFVENLSITLEKIKGALSEKVLIIFACVSFAILLLFMILALSTQSKFAKRCKDLKKFIKSNNFNEKNINALEGRAKLISIGFYNGYSKFKNAESGSASDFINKKDSLDDKANYTFLHNPKPFFIFYIILTAVLLFVMNVVLKTGEEILTGSILGDAAVYPLMYIFLTFVVYLIYCVVSHRIYVYSEEKFNLLLNLIDGTMTKKAEPKPVEVTYVQAAPEVQNVLSEEPKVQHIEPVQEQDTKPATEQKEESAEAEPEPITDELYEEENEKLFEVGDDVLDNESERDIENFIGSIVQNNEEPAEETQEPEPEPAEETSVQSEPAPAETAEEFVNNAYVDNDEFMSLLMGGDAVPQTETVPEKQETEEFVNNAYVDNDEFMSLLMGGDFETPAAEPEKVEEQQPEPELANETPTQVEEPAEEPEVTEEVEVVEETQEPEEVQEPEPEVVEPEPEVVEPEPEVVEPEPEVVEPEPVQEIEPEPVTEPQEELQSEPVQESEPVTEEPEVIEEVEEPETTEEVEEPIEEFVPFTFIDVDGNGGFTPPPTPVAPVEPQVESEEDEVIVERSPLEVIDDHLLAANRRKQEEEKAKVEEPKVEPEPEPVQETEPEPVEPEPEKPKSEDDEIADLVGQFKNIQFESNDNYVPEKVVEFEEDEEEATPEEDETEVEQDFDEEESDANTDDEDDDLEIDFDDEDFDDEESFDDDDDYSDDELEESDDDEGDEDDSDDYEDDSDEEIDYAEDYDGQSNLFDDIMMTDSNFDNNMIQTPEQPVNPNYGNMNVGMQGQYYNPNQYQNPNGYYPPIIGYDQNGYPIYQNMGYGYPPMYPQGYQVQNPYNPQGYPVQENPNNFVQPQQPQPQPTYEEPEDEEYYDEEMLDEELEDLEVDEPSVEPESKPEEVVEKPAPKPAKAEESKPKSKGRTKKAPSTHARRKSESKADAEEDQKQKNSRGRPKTKTYDGPFEIQDDEEFEAVLEDATKLMRKSEGNLSDAQRTKIEKQLALLVEAMNNYKNKED